MNTKIIIKPAVIGFIASLVVTILIALSIHLHSIAPFNVPPMYAFLLTLGLSLRPLAITLHFLYGIFWSYIYIYLFRKTMTVSKGVLISLVMWLLMMVVYSPIIGWGFFGFFAPNHTMATDALLYLGSPIKYSIMTLVIHLIYGFIIGIGNTCWIGKCEDRQLIL